MIYEAYQEKVTKVANFLKKIFKHMAFIISTLSVVVLLLISFLATKGMILGGIEVNSGIVYGGEIGASAKALFSDVEFEYTDFGKEEWSLTTPTLAGKYEVRAKSKASFGAHRYSESVEFSIAPKDITVQILDTSIIYGENPTVMAELVGKDELECSEYVYENIHAEKTNVEAKKESITIYNANGKDVTSCYNIITAPSKIDIAKRPLEVTVSSQSMVYNGTTLAYDGYEISGGSLGFTDKLGAEFNSSITDVGSVVNTPDLIVRNAEGIDVTFHYDVKVNVGKLTVTQRPVVVVTPTEDKTYDGEELSNGNVDIYYGDDGVADPEEETLGGTEEETTEFKDPELTTMEDQSIDIEPMPPVEEYTDGSNLAEGHYWKNYYIEWSEEEQAYVEALEIIESPFHYDLNHDNTCDFCNKSVNINNHTYKDADSDSNCDSCVEIVRMFGRVVDLDEIDMYGEPDNTPALYDRNKADTNEIGIVNGHKVVLSKLPAITNVGYITNAIYVDGIYDSDGNDKTANYSLFYDFGTLTVNPRAIVVGSESYDEIYDGAEHSFGKPTVSTSFDYSPIADNQRIVVTTYPSVIDYTESAITNKLGYYIEDASGNDVTSNYQITENWGTLNVQKRPLSYYTESYDEMYDGQMHTFEIVIENEDTVFDGMAFEPQPLYFAISLEDYTPEPVKNDVELSLYDESLTVDLSHNFDMTRTSVGTINIRKREVILTTRSGSWVYDGNTYALKNPVLTTPNGAEYSPIAQYQKLVVTKYPSVKNYTETAVENKIEYYVEGDFGADVTSNYNITVPDNAWGTLEITKRPLVYHTESYDGVYDGVERTFGVILENENEFYDGMAFTPVINYDENKIKDAMKESIANTFDITLTNPNAKSNAEKDITANFDIKCTYAGTLFVRYRKIVIETESGEWMYDGYTHSLPNPILSTPDGCNYEPIAKNQSLVVKDYPTVKNYTKIAVENKLEYYIDDGQGNDVSYNYEITDIAENRGTLEITKRPLVYYTEDYNAVYDGIERRFGIIIENEIEFYEGMAFTPIINYTENTIKDAMIEPIANTFDITLINPNAESYDERDITSNFDIYCTHYGMLFVSHRKIIIETGSGSWTYDGYAHSLEYPILSTRESYNPVAPNQRVIVTKYPTVKNWTKGVVENKIEYYIDDGQGNDVTYNYEIINKDMGWGTLEITQRELSITTYGGAWTYDGMWHSNDTLDFGRERIAEGDTYIITNIPTVRNYTPTPVVNNIGFRILTSDGENSLLTHQNYVIVDESYGTLAIDPLRIYFASYSDELTYDGYTHAPDINSWASDSGEYTFSAYYNTASNTYEMSYSSLGDMLVISNYNAYKHYTDGEYKDIHFDISIYDALDGSDSVNELGNYIIESISFGSVKINKRQLYYTTPTNVSLIYNGNFQSATNVTFSKYGNNNYSGIATTDKVRIDGKTELIDYDGGNYVENVVIFTIVDANGEDMSHNYEIYKKSHGYLRMNQRLVYVNTNSNAWEYDGLEHYDNGFTVSKRHTDGYDMVSGDNLTFNVYTTVVDVGRYTNNLSSPTVYSTARGKDVTNNYRIVTSAADKGTLVINPRKISIKPIDAWKVYDGKYLTVSDWEYVNNSKQLLDGHYISEVYYVNNSQIDVGLYYTGVLGAIITDSNGNDISYRYELVGIYGTPEAVYGTLEIEKLKIFVSSENAKKPYDGMPLINHTLNISYINGNPIDGDVISADFTGIIIGVGITDNTFQNVTVIDKHGNDVTENYDFEGNISFGKLEITRSVVGKIYSNETNYEYIKTESFGDYIGSGFAAEPIYDMSNYLDLGPESLVSMAFRNNGYSLTKQILISGISATAYYSDVYDGSMYYTFPNDLFGNISILKGNLGNLSGYEQDYRGWVYGNYTAIDYETYYYLQDIIREYGFDASNSSVYEDVALYIQSSARYGFECAEMLDSSSNIVVSFLSHEYGDEGVCRHYAAAATMLYRALGIPARYTEGYLVETKAGEWVDITTPGHAWVEVYIDDLGWIPVEVTAGDGNGFEMNNGNTASGTVGGVMYEKPEKIKVHVKPEDMIFKYTGSIHKHSGIIESANCECGSDGVTLEYLESMGYEIVSGVNHGTIIDSGVYNAYINGIQIYYNGQNVTYKFSIEAHMGTITVKQAPIELHFVDVEKVFDGNMLYPSDQIGSWNSEFDKWLSRGYRFEYSLSVNGEQGVIDVGNYVSDVYFTVYDAKGNDVTNNFDFSKAYGGEVVVKPFEIQIYLYQNHKMYDGKVLTYASAFASGNYYRVMNTLPDGFELSSFEVTLELIDVASITVEEFNNNSFYYNYSVVNGIDDVTHNFAIKFVKLSYGNTEIDYIPMQITPRQITVTTATQTKVNDGNTLTNTSYVIGGAGMVDGEFIDVSVVGECVYPSTSVENSIDAVFITDRNGYQEPFWLTPYNGEEVQLGNYKITFIYGMLEITE